MMRLYMRHVTAALTAALLTGASTLLPVYATADEQNDTQYSWEYTEPAFPKGSHSFPGNDGKPHTVGWDEHSFTIDGKRLMLWAGEFHPWRLPSPQAWRDVLQKIKAAGFNAVSFYFFWGDHQWEKDGSFHFDKNTHRDIDLLLTMAAEEGLYVIARPGPYVNAEISMGGLPAYLSNNDAKSLRSTDPDVYPAAKKWLREFNSIVRNHLITKGKGSVIMYQVENELLKETDATADYLKKLSTFVRNDGIDVPLFENDWGLSGQFAPNKPGNAPGKYGKTGFYAYDRYPLGFNCSAVRKQITDVEDTFREVEPTAPQMIAEGQGGAFTPWGADFTPELCAQFTDANFMRQWGTVMMGNGVKSFTYYMIFGGTNWGYTGSPSSGFTSYDYGAGIDENRTLRTEKFGAQKEMAYFMQALPDYDTSVPVRAPSADVKEGSGHIRSYERVSLDEKSAQGKNSGKAGTRVLGFVLDDTNNEETHTFTVPLDLTNTAPAEKKFSTDSANKAITYSGSWKKEEATDAWEGSVQRSTEKDATATFSFTGTGIRLAVGTGTDHGKFSVQVDDQPAVEKSGWVATEQNKPSQFIAFEANDLPYDKHTITVKNLGQKAKDSKGGTTVDIDAFKVLGADKKTSAPVKDTETSWARIPQKEDTYLTLHGRDALLIAANTKIANHHLLYTTSQMFGHPIQTEEGFTQYLVGHRDDAGETVLDYQEEPKVDAPDGVTVTWDKERSQLRLNYTHGDPLDITITPAGKDSKKGKLHLRIIDRGYANTTWLIDTQEGTPTQRVAVENVELARTFSMEKGVATLTGTVDNKDQNPRILLPRGLSSASWNGGDAVKAKDGVVSIDAAEIKKVGAPKLEWVKKEGAPEIAPDFDDSSWKKAESHSRSTEWQAPAKDSLVLDSNHYGFYEGSVWYRAHFTAKEDKPEITLTGNGGTGQPDHGKEPAFMQIWANGESLGAQPANGEEHTVTAEKVKKGDRVVLSVLVHNLGQNLDWNEEGLSRQNRGLYSASIPAEGSVTWKIQGARNGVGDPVRGLYNNGGLYGEREGWYLPDFDASQWEKTDTMRADKAGVTWYRSAFDLKVPATSDPAFMVTIDSERFSEKQADRKDGAQAIIYVNGWNIGTYIGDIGPQNKFTIPRGLLHQDGKNTIAVAVAAKDKGMGPDGITIDVAHVSDAQAGGAQ